MGKMGSSYKLHWLTAVSLLVVLFISGAEATGFLEKDGQNWGGTMADSNVANSDDDVEVRICVVIVREAWPNK